jgi:hypothetical protein
LHLCLLGIESFSDEELALLNKGTTSEQNCRAAQLLIALERDHPGSFEFQKYGGFSLLLFTPWTRLENLALNLAIIRRCRLADYCGKLFTSRLRLYPSLPMYPMALRDGLVLERYEDPRLDTARRNFYDDEVPWKFASSPMEVVCSLLLRLQDAPGSTDPLASSLAALMPRHPHTGHMLALAEALVDEALSHPSASAEEIVASVQRSVTNPVEGIGQPSEREGVGPRDGEPMPPLLIALSGGLKPVARLEGADVEARGWSDDVLRRVASVVQQRLPFSDVAGPPEVFVGRDRNAVMRAIELTDRMERAEDDAEWQDAAAEVGVLLGYPACCSQAFAKRPPSVRKSYMWLYVQSRLDHPGPVDPLLNPGPEHVINYVPCSLGCQPTRALARRMVDLLRERSSTREFERLVQACAHPWLLFVDQQGDAVELVTDHEPSGRFPYHAGLARGSNPLIPRIVEGDELEIGSQHALVFRKGSLIASLGGRAFVWWHRAPVQESLWRSMLALRFEPRRPALQGARDAGGTPGPDAQKIAKLLDQLLGLSSGREIDFLGFRVRSITPEREDQVRIELRHQNVTLVLMATPAAKDTPAYAHAGPLALYHPRDAKIDTRRKQLATQKLTAYLVQAFRQPPTRSDLRDPTPSEP